MTVNLLHLPQAENILQFNVFSAPKAVVSLKVAGKLSGESCASHILVQASVSFHF